MQKPGSIEFRALAEAAAEQIIGLHNDAAVRRHLPLADGIFTVEQYWSWLQDKQSHSDTHGFGVQSIWIRGNFAGWGGLQYHGSDVDLALVLHTRFWGNGGAVARRFLEQAFAASDPDQSRIESVTVLLPVSRTRLRALRRWRFEAEGRCSIDGFEFERFRLTAVRWRQLKGMTTPANDNEHGQPV